MDALQRKSYSKYRTGRTSYRRRADADTPRDIREVILMQCIVSAMILICAMGLIFIKLPAVQDMRASVKRVLSEETTAENIMQITDDIAARYNGLKASIQGIFGNGEPPQTTAEQQEQLPQSTAIPGLTEGPADTEAESPLTADFRIDEDVLQTIDSTESFYIGSDGVDAEKKQEAPTD